MPKYLKTKEGSLESAVLEAVSPAQQAAIAIAKKEKGEKPKNEEKVECPKCKGEGCDHCDDKGYHMEAISIDPDDGEVTKAKDDSKKKKKTDASSGNDTSVSEANLAEVDEPSAPLGKKFKDMHTIAKKDYPAKDDQGMTKAVKPAKQPKTVKELRK